ncbi:MAG: peptidylprolyl isomerase [Candidatus Liptonbacteria bacterium RIFCSPLOWO2_01_FULL_56_20]|uniref:Peptidyl-prolyl cis-trans isomerase n=1 Tax=Candidatus Liptonbacteria bacterium RIFCSPLOWO2_01_FULL_56_20 TaxID=1798652 RepID=A0A1G2CHU2_9BACT|nr:MAG: peptidylprolyl isomerase [Candidatus Liptonbacteria bacterium RIFCSPHIGHO2_01_FULL_56_18b]OGZ00782.1 MAG: peptidylprolyl isomerase [Candidatus Liptonbacteria bacterium RIFCSPLOWO2_01_FULL_56_20]
MTEQTKQNIMEQFKKEDVVVGQGQEAKSGDTLAVHYAGTLADGTKFDSSYDHGEPIEFKLGAGDVIPGWDLGLLGVRVGGKRNLVIPPELAYGDRSAGPIPPNSTLYFTVELVDVK